MGKGKKGQLTIFMIVGVLLLLIFGGVVFVNSSLREKFWQSTDVDKTQLNNMIATCTKEVVENGIVTVGMKENNLRNYISTNMIQCTNDFMAFRKKGYDVNASFINTSVLVNDKVIAAYINYPVEIKKGDFLFKSENSNYITERVSQYELPVGEDCKLTKTVSLTSPDTKMELIINKGTCVKDSKGLPAKEINITIKNNYYDKDRYGIIMPLVYEFTDGVSFEPDATLVYAYADQNLPTLMNENSIRISYYDRQLGDVIALQGSVDTIHNKITSSVEHFTDFVLTTDAGCLDANQAEQEFNAQKPKVLLNLNDAQYISKDVAYSGEQQSTPSLECTSDTDCSVPLCDVGIGWALCENNNCRTGCNLGECDKDNDCDTGKKCDVLNGVCILQSETSTSVSESAKDNELIRQELPDGGYNYSFRIKPSDCGADGVCYVALVVIDDSNLLIPENAGDTI